MPKTSTQTIIDFTLPRGWHELTDRQLRYVYSLIAQDFNIDAIKTLCLLRWTKTKLIGRQPSGAYLLKKDSILFEATPIMLAEVLSHLDWISNLPSHPVCISHLTKCGRRLRSIAPDFEGEPFEKFIVCDNLFQGYLQTQDDALLSDMAEILYGHAVRLSASESISVFYWFSAVKAYFASKWPDFFQPASASADGNLLGTSQSVEQAMNAQIRALTKGDITKERDILALDTWRALTELNAQAKEYAELNSKLK